VSNLQDVAIAVVIFLGQLLVARWWLARFRYGPLEWVWRCLTYAQRQPLRRPPAPSAPTPTARPDRSPIVADTSRQESSPPRAPALD